MVVSMIPSVYRILVMIQIRDILFFAIFWKRLSKVFFNISRILLLWFRLHLKVQVKSRGSERNKTESKFSPRSRANPYLHLSDFIITYFQTYSMIRQTSYKLPKGLLEIMKPLKSGQVFMYVL